MNRELLKMKNEIDPSTKHFMLKTGHKILKE